MSLPVRSTVFLTAFGLLACSNSGGEAIPCSRDTECLAGERCISGACVRVGDGGGVARRDAEVVEPPDAEVEPGPPDAAGPGRDASVNLPPDAGRPDAAAPAGPDAGGQPGQLWAFAAAASNWTYACYLVDGVTPTACNTTFSEQGGMVHVVTDASFDFAAIAPTTPLGWSTALFSDFVLTMRASNRNLGWQGEFPVIVIVGPEGKLRYQPTANLLPVEQGTPLSITLPLSVAPAGWTLTVDGAVPSRIDQVEIHADTWDVGFELWFEVVGFTRKPDGS